MSVEIERKFLINRTKIPFDLEKYANTQIRQGYVTSDPQKVVRLRMMGGQCFITIKSGVGATRHEYEGAIPRETFDALWPAVENRFIEKTRYQIPGKAGVIYELDIYHGQLQGFCTVEVEFDSEVFMKEFIPPKWFGLELTEDVRYNNLCLALNGLPV